MQMTSPTGLTIDFPDRVRDCNHYLQEILSVEGRVSFWKLFGLYCEDPTVHAQDGVHFNARGNYKLYRAIRGAVLQGLDTYIQPIHLNLTLCLIGQSTDPLHS